MKVKCITSRINPVFVVGEIYETENNEIYGNENRYLNEPWIIGHDLKITAQHGVTVASFQEAQ